MGLVRRVSFEQLGAVVEADTKTAIQRIRSIAGKKLQAAAFSEVVSRTPVEAGKLKRKWVKVSARGRRGGPGVGNPAAHAATIDLGRRLGVHDRKKGGTRMMGSPQAPEGITTPALEALPVEAILKEAIAEASA